MIHQRSIAMLAMILSLGFQSLLANPLSDSLSERRIPLEEYRDRMTAGWIGQMAGVGWGAPTEFQFVGVTIPENEVPEWDSEMINVFGQDDMYVEMTFLQSLLEYGIDVSIKQAGIDFANSSYLLWVANRTGRENLRKGIAPPNSGHPKYNPNADAIDYQIEADYSGLISPGLPNQAVLLGETFGRIMNYGDGLYGGQFVGAMYSIAFYESDPKKIVEEGLKYIPAGSQYAEAVRDVLRWHEEKPNDWEHTWELINEKYHKNPEYRKFASSMDAEQNIDAKLNGAYIVMGLLYGEGDPDQTIVISMRCGQDSDCNPSNAAGILFTAMGLEAVPERFKSALDKETKFSFTNFTFPELLDVSEKLALQILAHAGGRLENDVEGNAMLVIPVEDPRPGPLEQSWNAGEPEQVSFTREELSMIEGSPMYKWVPIILLLLVLLVLKRNRNLKAAIVLIPFACLFLLLELASSAVSPDLLGTVNIIVMLQSLSVAMAVLLLLAPDKNVKWFGKAGVILLVLVLVGFLGAIGASDGRFAASTKITLIGTFLLAFTWFFTFVVTLIIVSKKYNRTRFNLIYFGSLYLFQVLGIYLIVLAMSKVAGPWSDMAGSPSTIFIGALALSLLLYLISLPYLVLVRYNTVFRSRFQALVNEEPK